MILLSRRCLLAIAAVVDVAQHSRPQPVAARALAARHNLPPRHLETLLQTLVHAGILKGLRGPRGGYELARERRRITIGEIVRAVLAEPESDAAMGHGQSVLVQRVVEPLVEEAGRSLLAALEAVTVDDLSRKAEIEAGAQKKADATDFTI